MSDGDLLQEYDNAVGDSDDHLAGLRAVERAARVAAFREAADVCDGIERDRKAYAESAELDEIEGEHVLSQAIGAADCAAELRARAEEQR